ncbi:MAG: hypothetical protein ABW048_13315 [Sphingobium sp.]
MNSIEALAALIRDSRGVRHKADIASVVAHLGIGGGDAVPVGDDTAVIPDREGGHLLLSTEGFVEDFVAADPWFAGYRGVMVIWCTGFRMDFSFLNVPVFDGRGYPAHDRGVSAHDGLYFIGLPWLYTWGSGRFAGVARDAAHIVDHIAADMAQDDRRIATG